MKMYKEGSNVNYSSIGSQSKLPLVIEPNASECDLHTWLGENRDEVLEQLLIHGGILFRGFDIDSVSKFESLTTQINPNLEEYRERSTPRSAVHGKVYTSTEYPADMDIPQHNENSYQHAWPMKIWFYSVQCALTGGETPIADSREVYKRLSPTIVEKFTRKKVMYVRNLGAGIDLPWQTVFQTENKTDVENYCNKAGIQYEWISDSQLRTKVVRNAVAAHKITKEMVWFNQAHLFHYTSLPEEIQEYLINSLGEENLSRNAYYGDGSPIEQSILDEIRDVYNSTQVKFPWKQNDVLLLDNMLTSHGRAPYTGSRKVLVAMSEVYSV